MSTITSSADLHSRVLSVLKACAVPTGLDERMRLICALVVASGSKMTLRTLSMAAMCCEQKPPSVESVLGPWFVASPMNGANCLVRSRNGEMNSEQIQCVTETLLSALDRLTMCARDIRWHRRTKSIDMHRLSRTRSSSVGDAQPCSALALGEHVTRSDDLSVGPCRRCRMSQPGLELGPIYPQGRADEMELTPGLGTTQQKRI